MRAIHLIFPWITPKEDVRFYSLYDKICRLDILWEAWCQVKANKDSPGIDGKAITDIINEGEESLIIKLQKQLREQNYQFSPVRIVEIPKPNECFYKLLDL